jgi:predicted DsbA family dithiol-disulfide isomerase
VTATEPAPSPSNQAPSIQLDIYSDVICPWCYIGKRKVERALATFAEQGGPAVSLRWRPFLLHPEFEGSARPTIEYLAGRFGPQAEAMLGNVTQIASTVGLGYRMDRSLIADTRPAHQLSEAAYEHGGEPAQGAVTESLLHAHFVEGLDVSDTGVLTRIGAAAGMSADAIDHALHSPEAAESIAQELAHAHAIGVNAVPTFVTQGRYGVAGAQDPSVLLGLLQRAAAEI